LSQPISIRAATPADADAIHSLIVELAVYERAPEKVTGDAGLLTQWLFGPDPAAEALIAELGGAAVGFALFYRTFSTWEARPGLWLEDLYVVEACRGLGVGRALMEHLAGVTVKRGYTRLEWVALDWNAPALGFYDTLGATLLHDWRMLRLEGESLARVAASSGW
jgi:GNAT superfamily N-acetyltransferase